MRRMSGKWLLLKHWLWIKCSTPVFPPKEWFSLCMNVTLVAWSFHLCVIFTVQKWLYLLIASIGDAHHALYWKDECFGRFVCRNLYYCTAVIWRMIHNLLVGWCSPYFLLDVYKQLPENYLVATISSSS